MKITDDLQYAVAIVKGICAVGLAVILFWLLYQMTTPAGLAALVRWFELIGG